MNVSWKVIAAFGASTLAASCSSFLTSKRINAADESAEQSAAIYSLPRGLIKIEGKLEAAGAQSEPVFKIEVSEALIPDTRTKFKLNYERSWFSADALQVKTSNGLLSTVAGHVDDRTSEAIINLSRSIGAVQGFTLPVGGGGATTDTDDPGKDPKEEKPNEFCAPTTPFTIIVDPHKDLLGLNQLPWLVIEPELDLKARRTGVSAAQILAPTVEATAAQLSACSEGLCTRSARPVRVRINKGCNVPKGIWYDKVLYLPDETEFTSVRLERDAFADKCFGIGFHYGMVNEVRLRSGSAAENVARLPEGILKAIVAIPTQLIQLRFNNTTSELDLIKAERALEDYLKTKAGEAPGKKGAEVTDNMTKIPDIEKSPAMLDAECRVNPSGS